MKKYFYNRQFILFTIIGVSQYIIDVSIVYCLLLLDVNILIANIFSRSLVGFGGYFANRHITFRDSKVPFLSSFFKYLLAWFLATFVSTAGLAGLVYIRW
jgi:putative flippase GtrA